MTNSKIPGAILYGAIMSRKKENKTKRKKNKNTLTLTQCIYIAVEPLTWRGKKWQFYLFNGCANLENWSCHLNDIYKESIANNKIRTNVVINWKTNKQINSVFLPENWRVWSYLIQCNTHIRDALSRWYFRRIGTNISGLFGLFFTFNFWFQRIWWRNSHRSKGIRNIIYRRY